MPLATATLAAPIIAGLIVGAVLREQLAILLDLQLGMARAIVGAVLSGQPIPVIVAGIVRSAIVAAMATRPATVIVAGVVAGAVVAAMATRPAASVIVAGIVPGAVVAATAAELPLPP